MRSYINKNDERLVPPETWHPKHWKFWRSPSSPMSFLATQRALRAESFPGEVMDFPWSFHGVSHHHSSAKKNGHISRHRAQPHGQFPVLLGCHWNPDLGQGLTCKNPIFGGKTGGIWCSIYVESVGHLLVYGNLWHFLVLKSLEFKSLVKLYATPFTLWLCQNMSK